VVRKKIWKAFSGGQPTAELQRKLGGNPDIDVAFQWLYYFFEPDNSRIEKIREDYRSGALLSGDLKEYLIEKVTSFLEEHQANRENAREMVNLYLRDGELASRMWRTIYGDED
jgi:tryptophanyl-tRNA synthetase